MVAASSADRQEGPTWESSLDLQSTCIDTIRQLESMMELSASTLLPTDRQLIVEQNFLPEKSGNVSCYFAIAQTIYFMTVPDAFNGASSSFRSRASVAASPAGVRCSAFGITVPRSVSFLATSGFDNALSRAAANAA